jgi:hypothetical protein
VKPLHSAYNPLIKGRRGSPILHTAALSLWPAPITIVRDPGKILRAGLVSSLLATEVHDLHTDQHDTQNQEDYLQK